MSDPAGPGARLNLMPPMWMIGLLALMCGAVIAWRVPALLKAIEERRLLGPDAMTTNGFTLTDELMADPTLIRWGAPEEVIPIDVPRIWDVEMVDELGSSPRTRFLVSDSEVVGVVIDGKARAYPLRILQWHEVVNDVLNDVAIAVIYHPLSETWTVFHRPTSADGDPLVFGSSGLVVDCCLLIHERLGPGKRSSESLWSPTDGEAISGMRAGEHLSLVPFRLTRWKNWREQHPDTDVLGMAETHRRLYKKEPFNPYRLIDRPQYPYSPQPPPGSRANLSRVMITRQGNRWVASSAPYSDMLPASAHVVSSWFAVHAREILGVDP